jgi:hypothetical protein
MDMNMLIIKKYEQLPADLKETVAGYIDYLVKFMNLKNEEDGMNEEEKKKKRIFGIAKGMFNMKDNFDEPLDEFKDYM